MYQFEKTQLDHMVRQIIGPELKEQGFSALGHSKYCKIISKNILQLLVFQSSHIRVTCNAAVQPLFVPSDSITLEIGNRLGFFISGQDKWWHFSSELELERSLYEMWNEITIHVLPWFDQMSSTSQIVQAALFAKKGIRFGTSDWSYHYHLGFCAAAILDYAMAANHLEKAKSLLQKIPQPWSENKVQILDELLPLLRLSDARSVENLLKTYTQQTAESLKIYPKGGRGSS